MKDGDKILISDMWYMSERNLAGIEWVKRLNEYIKLARDKL